jgi:hypothetical protein
MSSPHKRKNRYRTKPAVRISSITLTHPSFGSRGGIHLYAYSPDLKIWNSGSKRQMAAEVVRMERLKLRGTFKITPADVQG